jgi:hypothetical protein
VLRAALRDHSQYLDRRAISRRIRLGAGRLDPACCYRTFFLENPAAPPIWGDPWRFSNFVSRREQLAHGSFGTALCVTGERDGT